MRLEYLGRLLVLNYFDLPVHIRDHQGLPDLPYTLVDECNFEARGCVFSIYGGGGAEFSHSAKP